MGVLQHVDRHLGRAAELPRQRPFGADAVAEDAAEHLDLVRSTGRSAARAIFSTSASQSTANRRTPSSRARAMSRSFLIVLPKEMRSARRAGREHHLDLGDRSGVEAGAEAREAAQHLGRRVGLHGVEHARIGQGAGEVQIVVTHDVEVDDEAGPVFASIARGTRGCARSWRAPHQRFNGGVPAAVSTFRRRTAWLSGRRVIAPACVGDTTSVDGLFAREAAFVWMGSTPTARRARWTSLFSRRHLEGRLRPKKPAPSLL